MSVVTGDFASAVMEASRYSRLGTFGVEIDFDMSQPLDERSQVAFRDIFYKEGLLLFRGQDLTM